MYLYCLYSNNITATVNVQQSRLISRTFDAKSQRSSGLLIFLSLSKQYDTISTGIYFSNFVEFDEKTKKAMILLMQTADVRPMKIQTVTFVKFELSLEMYVKVKLVYGTWRLVQLLIRVVDDD